MISHESDEAILLWNLGPHSQSFAGWRLITVTRQSTFPITSTLTLAQVIDFGVPLKRQLFELALAKMLPVSGVKTQILRYLDLDGALQLTNRGGAIHLLDGTDTVVDTLLYSEVQKSIASWQGNPAMLYTRGNLSSEGKVWHRKRDLVTDLPLDNDRAEDWAGDLADVEWGRRIRMPGWRGWERGVLAISEISTSLSTVTVAVGPEGLYQPLSDAFARASSTIDMSLYTFEIQKSQKLSFKL